MSIAVSANGAKGRFRDGQSADIGQNRPYSVLLQSGHSSALGTGPRYKSHARPSYTKATDTIRRSQQWVRSNTALPAPYRRCWMTAEIGRRCGSISFPNFVLLVFWVIGYHCIGR